MNLKKQMNNQKIKGNVEMMIINYLKNISEENKKYKLQIDTIEALKKQFKKEIDISFKRSETITKEDRKYLVKSVDDNKLIKLYQLLGLMQYEQIYKLLQQMCHA